MKNKPPLIATVIALLVVFIINNCFAQSVSITTTGNAADQSSMLEVASDNKGILIPRVNLFSTIDVATIPSPANSLLVFNENEAMSDGSTGYWYYDAPNLVWVNLGVGSTGATGATGAIGATGVTGATGNAVNNFAEFYALMPGDNTATVAVGAAIEFPQDGPTDGVITRVTASTFKLPAIGTYQIYFQASITEPGQLIVGVDEGAGLVEIAKSVVGRATGTSQLVGITLITTVVENSILSVRNPTGNATALTITPNAGGAYAASANLVIKRIN